MCIDVWFPGSMTLTSRVIRISLTASAFTTSALRQPLFAKNVILSLWASTSSCHGVQHHLRSLINPDLEPTSVLPVPLSHRLASQRSLEREREKPTRPAPRSESSHKRVGSPHAGIVGKVNDEEPEPAPAPGCHHHPGPCLLLPGDPGSEPAHHAQDRGSCTVYALGRSCNDYCRLFGGADQPSRRVVGRCSGGF